MSLLDENAERFVRLKETVSADGYGGYSTKWIGLEQFTAEIVLETPKEITTAEKKGVGETYNVYTSRNIRLRYHDVIKRLKDGKVLRITSNNDEVYTPPSATLDLRVVTAENWTIPKESQGDTDG